MLSPWPTPAVSGGPGVRTVSTETFRGFGQLGEHSSSRELRRSAPHGDRGPTFQPGTGRPLFSQSEPNEICPSQNLRAQTDGSCPSTSLVFLKGIELEGVKNPERGETWFSNIPSRTSMRWRRTRAGQPPSASSRLPVTGSVGSVCMLGGPSREPRTPQSRFSRGAAPSAGRVAAAAAAGCRRRGRRGAAQQRSPGRGAPDSASLRTQLSRGPARRRGLGN